MPQYQKDDIFDEGVMISFGDVENGGGNDMTVKETYSPPNETSAPKTLQKTTATQELLTQKTPSSVKISENKKQTDEKKKQADLQRQAEQQRIAEQRRREQMSAAAQNVIGGAFGNSGGQGSGTTSGDTRQGNPAGKGTSGGNSWSLNGRDLYGSLIKPNYTSNEEGKITVEIRVDANGNVTSAKIVSPSTISDFAMRNSAMDAAKRTKFTGGNGAVIGTITYTYRLN